MEHIVVGIDDSPGARAATAWALREAELRGAELEAVHAWFPPAAEGFNTEWANDREFFEKKGRAMMAAVVAEARAAGGAGVEPTYRFVIGEGPANALVECSKHADLLVVGSRGRGGFIGLALGSVSTACAHHADCPVVIVRAPQTAVDC